jgi:chorismate dehydratase
MRIGATLFLNTKPMVYGLQKNLDIERMELTFDTPADNSRLLRQNELDLALIPSIQYARIDDLFIVPGMSIAASGPVASVNLYCKKPVSEVEIVAVDERSRTSVALLEILCDELYGVDPDMEPMEPDPEVMIARCDAALLIGDAALYCDISVHEKRDLGSDWFKLTSYPFVFAFWAGREGAADPGEVAMLQESLELGLMNIRKIAENYPAPGVANASELNERYLKENINYGLGNREIDGLKLFYIKAWEKGIIEGIPRIQFYEG